MINIKINLNNVSSNIDINIIAQEISAVIQQMTGKSPNININSRDDYSTSPLGLYKTKEYLKLQGNM